MDPPDLCERSHPLFIPFTPIYPLLVGLLTFLEYYVSNLRRITDLVRCIEPPVGDLATIVRGLITYYEAGGERMLRGLAQEARQPHLHAIIDVARASHREWLERAFKTYLERRDEATQRLLLAQLYTLTGVYTWYQLRHESGLSQEETAQALYEMIDTLLSAAFS